MKSGGFYDIIAKMTILIRAGCVGADPNRKEPRNMKLKVRITALLCVILMLLSSCNGGVGSGDDSDDSSGTDTGSAASLIDILATGDTAYQMIRPTKASKDIVDKFTKIRETIKNKYGVSLTLNDDWINPNIPLPEYEILFGNVDRDETRAVKADLARNEYAVRVVGKKIVIVGNNDDLTLLAGEYFIEHCLLATAPQIPSDLNFMGKGEYDVDDITINGISIDQFTVVTSTAASYSSSVKSLSETIRLLCGVELPTTIASKEPTAHEIVIGNTGRDPDERKYGYDDTCIYFKNGSLFLGGGSKWSVDVAVNYIKTQLATDKKTIEIKLPEDGTPVYSAICPDREAYIADPTLLPMHWKFTWEPEEWMLKFENKINTLMCKDKNQLFTVAHRADWHNYPENSIESIISVWAMGGDCVEIDIQYTADGIPIVMHDQTLSRMTDCSSYRDINGFPESANISEWTYEQITHLRLKEGAGGSNAALTPYKVPTLEEVLIACKDRLFVVVDKPEGWRYCDIPGIQDKSKEHYLYPVMEKTKNFTSILISYGTVDTSEEGTLSAKEALQIQKYVYDRTGEKMFTFLRAWSTRSQVDTFAKDLEKGSMTNSALIIDSTYDISKSATLKTYATRYPNTLIATWTIEDNIDKKSIWESIYKSGVRAVMTNDMMGLVQFAATKK